MQALERLQYLEELFLNGVANSQGQAFSIETLLDILIVLYDECCSSTLRREKSVSEFVKFGKFSMLYTTLCYIFFLNFAAGQVFSIGTVTAYSVKYSTSVLILNSFQQQ